VLVGGRRDSARAAAAGIPPGGEPRYLLPDSPLYPEARRLLLRSLPHLRNEGDPADDGGGDEGEGEAGGGGGESLQAKADRLAEVARELQAVAERQAGGRLGQAPAAARVGTTVESLQEEAERLAQVARERQAEADRLKDREAEVARTLQADDGGDEGEGGGGESLQAKADRAAASVEPMQAEAERLAQVARELQATAVLEAESARKLQAGPAAGRGLPARLAALEEQVVGEVQSGALIARAKALEELVLGVAATGPLPLRMSALEGALAAPRGEL
jgi:hypothetical protein